MSGLLGYLQMGAGAFSAQSAGVAVAGRNLANVNTRGYSRQRVQLEAELSAPLVGGVRANEPSRATSALLSNRVRQGTAEQGQQRALAASLEGLEFSLTDRGQSLHTALGAFFGAVSGVTSSPSDELARVDVLGRARELATSFQRAAQSINDARTDADRQTYSLADEANRLMTQIADANRNLTSVRDPVLEDQRDQAAQDLAELTGAVARIDPDGQMRITVGGGEVLVDGERAAQFQVSPNLNNSGRSRLEVVDGSHRADVTGALGGSLGGTIQFRDGTAATAAQELDQLAFDFASSVNAAHQTGAGLDGVSGRALFTPPTGVTGAATNLALDPTIANDPRLFAAAAAGAPGGDNTNALAMLGLKDQPAAGGNTRTFFEEALRTVSNVGQATRAAVSDRDVADARADSLANARDALSGVSTEEELAQMTAFQRAAEASLRFISTVNEMLSDLVSQL